ncbi:DNA repair protein SbcC/Rad50 [Gammaproteobacteria bacterium]
MRIIAIRGRNLASLAGDFAIDLEQGPLSRVNLYTITGATGAGKSTLLDALCLALFDTVPRLAGSPTVAVGATDTRLPANDVRNLLRQGTVEGWAEVDFVGSDQRRYRTRWEVRRSRGRADGRFQPQTMTLRELATDTPIGRTKSEVLAAIATRLGLNFDQFRRSVLLAQGDFAAFLKAREKERADLLERITGTELYGRISIAAYARAKQEKEERDRLDQQLKDLHPLEEETRIQLESEQVTRLAALHAARIALEEARRARDWHTHHQRLINAATLATTELTAATAQQSAAASRQIAWQDISRVQPLRIPLIELDRCSVALTHAEAALTTAQTTEDQANRATSGARLTLNAARVELSAASSRLAQTTPDLLRARALDARLTDARRRRETSMVEAATAQRTVQDTAQLHQTATRDQTERERRHAETVGWLTAHTHHADLADQWPRWDAELRRIHTLLEGIRDAQRATATAEREVNDLTAQLGLARHTAAASVEALERERTTLAMREVDAALHDGTELAHRRMVLEGEREQVRRCADQVAVIRRTRQGWDEALVACDTALGEAANAEVVVQRCTADLVPTRAAYSEAESALERATLAAGKEVAALRARLTEDTPCPVCGSLNHPWYQVSASFDELVKDQRRRVGELRRALEQLTTEQTRAQTIRDAAQRRADAQQTQADARMAELAVAERAWAAIPFPLAEEQQDDHQENNPLAPDLPKHFTARDERLRKQLAAIGQAEATARATQAAVTAARTAVDIATRAEATARDHLATLERAVATVAERQRAAVAEVVQKSQELASAKAVLAVPMANIEHWQSALDDDPTAFRARCEADAHAYRRHQTTLTELAQAIAHGQTEVARAAATAHLTREAAQQVTQKATEARNAEATLTQERMQLLGGRPADTVEEELQRGLRQAQTVEERAAMALRQAEESLIAARTHRILCAEDRERQHRTREAAHTELDQLLAGHHLNLPTLRKRLEHDIAWLEQERTELDALERAVATASIRLAERHREREDYVAQGMPTLAVTEIDTALVRAREAEETAQTSYSNVQFQLREDDQRRTQSTELRTARERKEQEWQRWETLRELIGSADGAKFRTYAQSLTLEALLGHANRHLEDLARRYRLARIPGAELELQVVDRELGNEIRGVHSLSGGETFLVSLALALALASLSSQSTQVESLFIDEGFGSLDPDTLDTALAALDALQAQGRKVGIISHIPALTERIGAQIRVETLGNGRSRVRVLDTSSQATFSPPCQAHKSAALEARCSG